VWPAKTASSVSPIDFGIHAVRKPLPLHTCHEILGCEECHSCTCPPTGASQMRQHNAVAKLEKRAVSRQRFGLRYIEGSTAKSAGSERFIQGLMINNRTACSIDQNGARLHPGQAIGIYDVMGFGRQWHMQRYEIRFPQQRAQVHGHRIESRLRLRIAIDHL
jgi:uncharacterized RmlC-like cupin family protein